MHFAAQSRSEIEGSDMKCLRDESQVSIGGLLALGYGRTRRSRKKRSNMNYVGDTVTVTGMKQAKEKKIWSEVWKIKPLDEEIKDEKSTRKMD
jgi:hypothetical protein